MTSQNQSIKVLFSPVVEYHLHGIDYHVAKSLLLQIASDAAVNALPVMSDACGDAESLYVAYYTRRIGIWIFKRRIVFKVVFFFDDSQYIVLSIDISHTDRWWLKQFAEYNNLDKVLPG